MAKRKTQETGISEADYRRARDIAQAYEREKAEKVWARTRRRGHRYGYPDDGSSTGRE